MIGDVHYSVEKWFADNWTATDVAYSGQEYRRGSETDWIAPLTLAVIGRPSRVTAYGADVLLTVNVFSVTSARSVADTAGALESALRALTITVYGPADIDGDREVIGYLRLQEPEFKAPRKDAQGHAGTVDVRGTLDTEV